MLENDVQGRTAAQLSVGSAGKQHRSKPSESANSRADAGSFATAGNAATSCPGNGALRDSAGVLAFAAGTRDSSLGIHGFLAAGIGAVRRGIQIHRVPVRKNERVQAHAKLAAAFDASRALGFDKLASQIRTDRDNDAIVLRERERRTEIDRIARLRAASGYAIFENHADARARWESDPFTGTRTRGIRRRRGLRKGRRRFALRARWLLREGQLARTAEERGQGEVNRTYALHGDPPSVTAMRAGQGTDAQYMPEGRVQRLPKFSGSSLGSPKVSGISTVDWPVSSKRFRHL